MEELGLHWIMLCGQTLKSSLKLRTLQMDMKLWTNKLMQERLTRDEPL
jgi:hypothetical protein